MMLELIIRWPIDVLISCFIMKSSISHLAVQSDLQLVQNDLILAMYMNMEMLRVS